jgi:putative tryptophan/tyrosine transport system substrate-binding protein
MGGIVRRREFIGIVAGGIVSLPVPAAAQNSFTPKVGILDATPMQSFPERLAAFRQGLAVSGYVVGRNVAIEYRSAEGRPSMLPELAAELVGRRVSVVATTGGSGTALVAKAATSTIPIVFTTGDDPVRVGLVASLSRPGGNLTGVTLSSTQLIEKRLELFRLLAPKGTTIAILTGGGTQTDPLSDEHTAFAIHDAGANFVILRAQRNDDLDATLALAVQTGAAGLLVAAAPYLMSRRAQIVALAARHALPAIYPFHEFCDVGGLMSYGPDLTTAYYQQGVYVGRILKGLTPGDLPVQLTSKFELVINLRTAAALGLTIPRLLNGRVDRVIE